MNSALGIHGPHKPSSFTLIMSSGCCFQCPFPSEFFTKPLPYLDCGTSPQTFRSHNPASRVSPARMAPSLPRIPLPNLPSTKHSATLQRSHFSPEPSSLCTLGQISLAYPLGFLQQLSCLNPTNPPCFWGLPVPSCLLALPRTHGPTEASVLCSTP